MKRPLKWCDPNQRRGTLLLAVLVCLTLCAMLLTYWLRLIVIERRQVRSYQAAMQTELLADAALARGKLRVQADPKYSGETWRPAAAALASPRATITYTQVGEGVSSRQLEISAEIGDGAKQFVRRTRTQTITIPGEEPAP